MKAVSMVSHGMITAISTRILSFIDLILPSHSLLTPIYTFRALFDADIDLAFYLILI